MMNHEHNAQPLSRAEIREQLAKFNAEDRRLTQRLADLYKSGQSSSAIGSDRVAKAHAAATAMLNGHAARILPKKALEDQTEVEVYILRDGVRLILDSLNRQAREAEEAETQERAEKLAPEFKALVREWLVTGQKFAQAEARAQAFLAAAGPAAEAIPLSGWIGVGACIRSPWGHDLDEMIAIAKANGVKI